MPAVQRLTKQADQISFWAFLACGVVGPLGMAPQEIFVVLAIIAWLTGRLAVRQWPLRMPAAAILAAWFFIALLSITQSTHLPTSIKGLQKLLKFFALFYAAAETLHTRKRLSAMFLAATIGAAIVSLNGLVQVAAGADLFYHRVPGTAPGSLPRLMSTFGHPNDYATYAVTVFPVCLVLALSSKHSKQRFWSWVVAASVGLSLLLTFSRLSVLAIAVSMTLFMALRRAWKTLAAFTCAGVVGAFSLPQPVKDWVASQPSWLAVVAQPLRFEIWQAGWAMIQTHPLLGIGVNMFVHDYIQYRIPGDALVAAYGHNHYIQLAAEIGVFGLLVFLGLMVYTARLAGKLLRDKEPWIRWAALGMGCGLAAFLTIGLLESALQSSRACIFFWIWLGALHGLALDRVRGFKV